MVIFYIFKNKSQLANEWWLWCKTINFDHSLQDIPGTEHIEANFRSKNYIVMEWS